MKALFTGSRDWFDVRGVKTVLSTLPRDTVIIHGGARGLDSIVDSEARALDFKCIITFPAQWTLYGRFAGPKRNRLMFDMTKPDVVYAFPMPKSKGTLDMMAYASSKGCPVVRYCIC